MDEKLQHASRSGFPEDITRTRLTLKATLRQQVQLAGGSSSWLAGACPRLASGSPPDLTDDELFRENIQAYHDYEHRLGLCAGCPPTGGACAEDFRIVKRGHMPVWRDRRVVTEPCGERWLEYKTRRRLENSNVPKFYWDSSVLAYPRVENLAALGELAALGDRLAAGAPCFFVLSGPKGSGKTRLLVALLRTLIRRAPRALLWYADTATVRAEMQQRYDAGTDQPADVFGHARESHILVVDNVDPGRYARDGWLTSRLESLLRERFLRRKTILMATHETREALESAFDVPGLSDAETCQLS